MSPRPAIDVASALAVVPALAEADELQRRSCVLGHQLDEVGHQRRVDQLPGAQVGQDPDWIALARQDVRVQVGQHGAFREVERPDRDHRAAAARPASRNRRCCRTGSAGNGQGKAGAADQGTQFRHPAQLPDEPVR
jgi:hypothetical protein